MSTTNAAATPQPFKNTTFSRISTEFQHHVRGTSRREIAKNRLIKELKKVDSENEVKETVNQVYKSVYGVSSHAEDAPSTQYQSETYRNIDQMRLQQIQLKLVKNTVQDSIDPKANAEKAADRADASTKFDAYMTTNNLKRYDLQDVVNRYNLKREKISSPENGISMQQTRFGRTIIQAPATLIAGSLLAAFTGPFGTFLGSMGIIQSSVRILKEIFKFGTSASSLAQENLMNNTKSRLQNMPAFTATNQLGSAINEFERVIFALDKEKIPVAYAKIEDLYKKNADNRNLTISLLDNINKKANENPAFEKIRPIVDSLINQAKTELFKIAIPENESNSYTLTSQNK